MSVKRLTWHLEILERAKKNLFKEQYQAVRTRLDLAITICKEMLKQAEEHKAKAMEAKKMKLLSILFYYLGDIASHTFVRWSWGGWVYQKLMLLSVECDKDFKIWKEVKPRKKRRKRK